MGQDSEVIKKNGLYVHYSPPKVLGVVSLQQLRQWARGGVSRRLERAVLAGQGRRLLAAADAVPLSPRLRDLIAKCTALHVAVERGSLMELQELLDSEGNRKKYVSCLDEAGVGLLHKAVYYSYLDIAEWLVDHYPHLVHLRDSEGRTALHYTAACRQEAEAAALLERAGAARGARDGAGRTLAHYRATRTLLTLPEAAATAAAMPARPNATGLVIKRHNIRIWCHECDMGRLQRVVWEGHGARLLSEVSSQPVVKKFLEAVPYLMNTIRDMHNAVIQNDLEGLLKLTSDPVPPQALSSRDVNNMTVMHKAAGLGHGGILKYIIERYPQGINDVDNDGRTPLHYAATVKDEQHTYNTLVAAGADESAVDNKNRTPGYYVNRSQEIDKSVFQTLPDAPRTPSSAYPSSWDWKILSTEFIADLNKKSRKKNLKASNENISSKKTITSTISENFDNNKTAMKGSSTHELISNLPELDDTEKDQIENISTNDIHESEDTNEETTEQLINVQEHEEKKDSLCENVDTTHTTIEENSNDKKIIEDTEQEKKMEELDDTPIDENEHEAHQLDSENNGNDNEDNERTESGDNIENQSNVIEDVNDNEVDQSEKNHELSGTQQLDEFTKNDKEDPETKNVNDIIDNEHKEEENIQQDINEQEVKEAENNETSDENKNENNIVINSDRVDVNQTIKEEGKELVATGDEGNYSSDHNEDDDDVQVQGDCHSDHSDDHDTNNLTVAESNISMRGNPNHGRNTHESLIEGIISGDAEQDSQDASMFHRGETVKGDILTVDNEIDPEVTELINTTNMEMLATLVLNGEGSRLIGRHSENTELQAFLDNVPTYMQKIKKVHLAAKEGNIRDLQAALDRRKFAIARDPISPNGATPLHVATVFGKTNIIKYLGGRFPETLSAVDFEGRTALHYGAVLPDNGYYYNLLQQLGANSKDLDDNGRSAEDYYKNSTLLPFNQLLMDYGISEEAAKRMLSDKVPRDQVSSRRVLDTPEALDTLERCYRLLASARPSRAPLSASSNKATPPLVLGRFLKQSVFEMIKYRTTKADHDLFDVIWPAVKKLPDNRNVVQTVEEDFPGGVTAPDYYVYEVFAEFMLPLVKDLHNINVNSELLTHPMSDFLKNSTLTSLLSSDPLIELNVDPNDEFVLSGTIECSRNLNGFELPLNLKIGKLENIERIFTSILMQEEFSKIIDQINPESDQKGGSYYTLNEVLEKPSEICATLASSGLLIALCDRDEIDDCTRLHGRHWPYGRGVYVSDDKTFAIWINIHDHFRLLISTPTDSPGEIGLPFSKLTYIMTYLHAKLDFVWDVKLGHLSSRPTFLGAGLRFSLIVNFPGLSKDSDNMKHLCAMRGLQYRETLSTNIARVSNYQCLNMTERNCFNDFATAVSNLLHLEKDLSMQNSAHIANMLTNIFKRKRSSLADLENPADEIPGKH